MLFASEGWKGGWFLALHKEPVHTWGAQGLFSPATGELLTVNESRE